MARWACRVASGKRRGEVEVRVALGAGLLCLWVGLCAEAAVCVWACVCCAVHRATQSSHIYITGFCCSFSTYMALQNLIISFT